VPLKDQAEQHRGVWVAGHGSEAFEGLLVEILDILGTSGVKLANNGMQRITDARIYGFPAIYLTPPDTIGCGFTSFAKGTG
jgi:hypothetical protein